MKKTTLVFGVIAGLIASATMAISMIIKSKEAVCTPDASSMIVGYLSMLIAFSLIFVAIKNYRDKQNGGVISFGKAFLMGLLIALIASTMYVITWAYVFTNYMPDFMDKYAAQAIEAVKKSGDAVALKNTTDEMNVMKEQYKNPLLFTLFTYAEIFPVGFLVSLIAALVLKRRKV